MDRPEIVANLPAVRSAELDEAARIIGYESVIRLGYRDSGMPESPDNARPDAFCNQDHEVVLERLVHIARRLRPDVLLGYDAHEFYPHPDHLYVHRLSLDLFSAAADSHRFPDAGDPWRIGALYAPVFSRERLGTLHRTMLERTGSSPFAGWVERIERVPTDPRQHITRVDVTGFVERGRDALRAHRTQIDPDGFWFQVPTELVEEVYPWEDFELLRSTVEVSGDGTDLFDGIA
jgi:mycothiol S-conjugate amidase